MNMYRRASQTPAAPVTVALLEPWFAALPRADKRIKILVINSSFLNYHEINQLNFTKILKIHRL